jgi:hypothetical protein
MFKKICELLDLSGGLINSRMYYFNYQPQGEQGL